MRRSAPGEGEVSRARRKFSQALPFVVAAPSVKASTANAEDSTGQDHRTLIRDGWILKRNDE